MNGSRVGLFPLPLDSVAMVMVKEITILLSEAEESIRGLLLSFGVELRLFYDRGTQR